MAKFLYKKYYASPVYKYDPLQFGYRYESVGDLAGYKSFAFDPSTGHFRGTGDFITLKPGQYGQVYVINTNKTLFFQYWYTEKIIHQDRTTSYISYYEKGSYIGDVVAEDGTYPENGAQGNYWYVKIGPAFPNIKVNIGGSWKECTEGWVNVNGAWKSIERILIKENGVWKES
ncbi:hypothetical protein [Brevibacillus laterosporus]|uniref:hypothetical protein n=1 Tax=Brevibacillus laterosporus TaxID=1465 RepID=UPI0018F8B6F9|nr:hypothetical protein [Brevibacillus laterosporus]MBG9773577.1 hypothetical protein [Brevibacillus laterosporus]